VLVPQEQNLTEKVPLEAWPDVKKEPAGIREAKDFQTGIQGSLPLDGSLLSRGLKLSFNRLKLPYSLRKHVRTTNLIESSFVEEKIREEKIRTKAIPGFVTEKSSLKPVFSTLTITAKRWRRVTFTKAELARPDRLKDEPGMTGLKEEVKGRVV